MAGWRRCGRIVPRLARGDRRKVPARSPQCDRRRTAPDQAQFTSEEGDSADALAAAPRRPEAGGTRTRRPQRARRRRLAGISPLAATAFPRNFPGATRRVRFAEERKMLLGTKWAMASPRAASVRRVGRPFADKANASAAPSAAARRIAGERPGVGYPAGRGGAARVAGFCEDPALAAGAEGHGGEHALRVALHPRRQAARPARLARTSDDGPDFLNVLRHLDLPQAAALAAERSTLAIYTADAAPWLYARALANSLGWPDSRLELRATGKPPGSL